MKAADRSHNPNLPFHSHMAWGVGRVAFIREITFILCLPHMFALFILSLKGQSTALNETAAGYLSQSSFHIR